MRALSSTLSALLLLITACGGSSRDKQSGRGNVVAVRGPDPILLRIPKRGGEAQAYIYPKLDSVIWISATAPGIDHILAFDPEAGLISFVDARGTPVRLDLRLGEVTPATTAKLTGLTSSNGSDVYGIAANGNVIRMTPSGDWTYKPTRAVHAAFPQPTGTLVVEAREAGEAVLWRVRPPDAQILDSAHIDVDGHTIALQVGDQVYFGADRALVGVGERHLAVTSKIKVKDRITSLAATPSGNRIFAAMADRQEVAVVNRFTSEVAASVHLPGTPGEMRVDPVGRYVLVAAAKGDSAWVIDVGTNTLVGSVRGRWRADLPAVTPDGAIATVRGTDVVFVEGQTLQPIRTVAGGASDYWFFFYWNGFRPRAAGLDRPVNFSDSDTLGLPPTARMDTTHAADTTHRVQPPPTPPAETAAHAPPQSAKGYIVQFAAMLSETHAAAEAAAITVNNTHPRIAATQRAGTTIYRVIFGPFPTKEEAERIGRESKHQYWVYEAGS